MQVKHIPSWFPGAGFKRYADKWRKHVVAMAEMPYTAVKQALVIQYVLPVFH